MVVESDWIKKIIALTHKKDAKIADFENNWKTAPTAGDTCTIENRGSVPITVSHPVFDEQARCVIMIYESEDREEDESDEDANEESEEEGVCYKY